MTPTPFLSDPMPVEPQWIDYNGHLNMAYYNVLFDRGVDHAYDALNIGEDYARTRALTTYTAEFHICYLRELHEGDMVRVSTQLLDHDAKRMHLFQEMHHEEGWLAATGEALTLHIDMSGPRVAPFPPDVAARLDQIARAHATLPRPDRAGRQIGIRRG